MKELHSTGAIETSVQQHVLTGSREWTDGYVDNV